ncbi:hypothetical protein BB560_001621 [Smittium megazygosporum]|uniref:JmjC domain-containing protein n=1 Tax=Smittium megazygosporum TaxID=133381 RepID=A0A2T9ZH19_9FUNG|nr:hypothetical protein BB560_001621 [Smittium megazygosporum]
MDLFQSFLYKFEQEEYFHAELGNCNLIFQRCLELLTNLLYEKAGDCLAPNPNCSRKRPKLELPQPKNNVISTTDNAHTKINTQGTNSLTGLINGSIQELSEYLKDYSELQISSDIYSKAKACWLKLYSDSCTVLGIYSGLEGRSWEVVKENLVEPYLEPLVPNDCIRGAIKYLDLAIVISGAPEWRLSKIKKLIKYYETIFGLHSDIDLRESKPFFAKKDENFENLVKFPIKRYKVSPSVLEFAAIINKEDCEPFVIENAMESVPALKRWNDVNYLKYAVGKYRLVPIEIGSKYTDESWTQKLLYFGEYLDMVVDDKQKDVYLAQHNLFKQSDALVQDFTPPDYCFVEPRCLQASSGKKPGKNCCGNTDLVSNIWLGPENSISPLHTDDFYNVFAQVVGFKYVKLVHQKYSEFVYPYKTTLLGNTSRVDAEHPNLADFPNFENVEYGDSILGPGDLLYIPVLALLSIIVEQH